MQQSKDTGGESPLLLVYTAREAEQLWGLSSGTVRAALVRSIIAGRKSAGTWLVTRAVMVAHYGEPPNNVIQADATTAAPGAGLELNPGNHGAA